MFVRDCRAQCVRIGRSGKDESEEICLIRPSLLSLNFSDNQVKEERSP